MTPISVIPDFPSDASRVFIRDWDWRYRVGFDADLRTRLQVSARALSDRHRRNFLNQLEFFSSLVSLQALADSAASRPHAVGRWLREAGRGTLLHCPAFLRQQIADDLPLLPQNMRAPFESLLDEAVATPYVNHNPVIFQMLLGEWALQVTSAPHLARVLAQIPDTAPTRSLHGCDDTLFAAFLGDRISYLLHANADYLGDRPAPRFTTEIIPAEGFAEYWPRQLSALPHDRLLYFRNVDTVRLDIIDPTLVHEILGHGIFFDMARDHAPRFVDSGAICLVEGWATWAEWHLADAALTAGARHWRLSLLENFYETDPMQVAERTASLARRHGHSEATAQSALLTFFQYPGFAESYVLGALRLQELFQATPPLEWLGGWQEWGDFLLHDGSQ